MQSLPTALFSCSIFGFKAGKGEERRVCVSEVLVPWQSSLYMPSPRVNSEPQKLGGLSGILALLLNTY